MKPLRIAFRPECLHDKTVLEGLLGERGFDGDRLIEIPLSSGEAGEAPGLPESAGDQSYAVELTSPNELATLIEAMGAVKDGHRMLQTLDVEEHFTGDFIDDDEARGKRILDILLGAEGAEKAVSLYQPIIGDEGDFDDFDDFGLGEPIGEK